MLVVLAHIFIVQFAEYLDLSEGPDTAQQRLVDTRDLLQCRSLTCPGIDHRPIEREREGVNKGT